MTGNGQRRPSDQGPDGIRQRKYSEASHRPGSRRLPDYAIVISASHWVKEHFPAAGANLWDALHTGTDQQRDPEPDLEAEP